MNQDENQPNQLVEAYIRMLERVQQRLQEPGETIDRAITSARDQAIKTDELGQDEARRIAHYIQRDLKDLGGHLQSPEEDLKGWLHIDLSLIEASIRDLLFSVADQAGPQLASFAHQGEPLYWHTGEITGPGVLECVQCREQLTFTEPSKIPPCPKCHDTEFVRVRTTHAAPSKAP